MNKFSLTGHVSDKTNGKFTAKIVLKTPDGRTTTIADELEHDTEDAAVASMKEMLERILVDFKEHGVEVASRRELRTV